MHADLPYFMWGGWDVLCWISQSCTVCRFLSRGADPVLGSAIGVVVLFRRRGSGLPTLSMDSVLVICSLQPFNQVGSLFVVEGPWELFSDFDSVFLLSLVYPWSFLKPSSCEARLVVFTGGAYVFDPLPGPREGTVEEVCMESEAVFTQYTEIWWSNRW
jgi:hypothetical protein